MFGNGSPIVTIQPHGAIEYKSRLVRFANTIDIECNLLDRLQKPAAVESRFVMIRINCVTNKNFKKTWRIDNFGGSYTAKVLRV